MDSMMHGFFRLMSAELIKLRRSAALRLVWLLPILFLILEFYLFERHAILARSRSLPLSEPANYQQIQMLGILWGGVFHPLMVAMLPALVLRPEHRFKLWGYLYTMPVPRRWLYLVKIIITILLCLTSLSLIAVGFWIERVIITWINPSLGLPFYDVKIMLALAWLLCGSLPILAINLWISDRINSLAVSVVFGLIGLLLTVALTGTQVPQPWKRDLIPWVLPYYCVQKAIGNYTPRQTTHMAGKWFTEEPNVLRLPDGRKIKTWQNVPDEVLFPPPPPTPSWILLTFSFLLGTGLFALGFLDSNRQRQ